MKFKVKTKDCHLVVRVKTSLKESIDEKELDRFSRIYLRGFLKPKMVKKNQIEYSGPIGISLYDYLKDPITKKDFFFVMEHIIAAVQKVQANNLLLNYMVMDIQNAYINRTTREVQFLYIPSKDCKFNADILEFMESIIYSAIPAEEKDMDYVSRFVHFLKGMKRFDIDKVEQQIAKEDRSVVNTIKKNNAGQSGFMTNKQQHYYDHYDQKMEDEEDEEATGLLNDDEEATGLLMDEEATGLLNADDEATGLLDDDCGVQDTVLLFEMQGSTLSAHFPTLFRVQTEETISVNKPVFRMGKENSYVDYFVTNNVAVSRSHADIITRGNKYYIKDLNSKNHTFVNDEILPVLCEVEIHEGDRIRLGNEEFVFHK